MIVKKKLWLLLILAVFFALVSFSAGKNLHFIVPQGWPAPVYNFKKNPLSNEKIALGRKLFYDPVLSRDSTISCSSCHSPYTAFTHLDHNLSHGIAGKIGIRNSPALVNLAWGKNFMWDGAVAHLDEQAIKPISNPVEMNETIEHVVNKLQHTPGYPALFYTAFGDSTIKNQYVLKALSQFMLTLVSANSKYDRVKKGEEHFTVPEENGYKIFQKNCNSCHTEPLFTNGKFENNGLAFDEELKDIGKMKVSHKRCDSLKFKVPTLRNIQYSYPYMHDGRFKDLKQVLNNYVMGVQASPTLNPLLKSGIYMTNIEKGELIAFLFTLTDKDFLHNPAFSFPEK